MPAKYKQLAAALRTHAAAGAYAASGRLPTEQTLARQYGVSRQTVRQALALLLQEGLIEKHQGSATRLAGQCQARRSIAVVLSCQNDYIFPAVLEDIQGVLLENGYTPVVFSTQNRAAPEREALLKILANPALCGVLMEGVCTALPNPNLDLYAKLRQKGLPLVFLYGAPPGLAPCVCVGDDNEGGGGQLTQYLLDLGHRAIGGIFKSDDAQGPQRYYGYACALRDAGLPLPGEHVLWYATEDRRDILDTGDRHLLDTYIQTRLRGCTAVVCYNDELAYWLVQELHRKGLRVPEDLSVVSFDNSYYSDSCSVKITSLAHEPHCLGRLAAQRLIDLLAGRPVKSTKIRWTLSRKESAAPR